LILYNDYYHVSIIVYQSGDEIDNIIIMVGDAKQHLGIAEWKENW
jgi:hypothetical protein